MQLSNVIRGIQVHTEAVKRGGGENHLLQSEVRVMVSEGWVQVVTETVGFQVLFRGTSPVWV